MRHLLTAIGITLAIFAIFSLLTGCTTNDLRYARCLAIDYTQEHC